MGCVRPATAWHALMRPPWRFLLSRWPWLALAYLLTSAVVGLVLLPVVLVSLLLVPLWGIAVGAVERRRTRMLGFPAQRSGHVPLTRQQRHLWLAVRMNEVATWRETAAVLVDILVGWVAFVVVAAQAVWLVVYGFIIVTASQGTSRITLFADVRITSGPATWWLVLPLALLTLGVFAYVNALLAAGQASLLRLLCGPRQREIARNVERLIQSRVALVESFEAERRRIERDLHDGVQQELVALAARLGMVSLELDDLAARGADVGLARDALDATQGQAEHAMAALRDTVRGIHPAVLSDHGLRAALEELADRTPVPLVLELGELGRLPTAVETGAYYVVTEAISNTAKHTAATRVTVRAGVQDRTLTVWVIDDGHGGADESAGTGLRGLRERAETLGGRFTLVSPDGGPTMLRLTLPIVAEGAAQDAAAAR